MGILVASDKLFVSRGRERSLKPEKLLVFNFWKCYFTPGWLLHTPAIATWAQAFFPSLLPQAIITACARINIPLTSWLNMHEIKKNRFFLYALNWERKVWRVCEGAFSLDASNLTLSDMGKIILFLDCFIPVCPFPSFTSTKKNCTILMQNGTCSLVISSLKLSNLFQ